MFRVFVPLSRSVTHWKVHKLVVFIPRYQCLWGTNGINLSHLQHGVKRGVDVLRTVLNDDRVTLLNGRHDLHHPARLRVYTIRRYQSNVNSSNRSQSCEHHDHCHYYSRFDVDCCTVRGARICGLP